MRHALIFCVLVTSVLAQVPKSTLAQFAETRKDAPSPGRLLATEEFAKVAGLEELGALTESLLRLGKSQLDLGRQIQKLEARYEAASKKAVSGDPLPSEALTAQGDLTFLLRQRLYAEREIDALVSGLLRLYRTSEDDAVKSLRTRAIAAALSSKDGESAAPFCLLLAGMGHPDALTALESLVRSKKPAELRVAAITSLGSSLSPSAEAPLLMALTDDNAVIRGSAIVQLGAIGGKDAVSALIARVDQEQGRLQEETILALRRLTGVNHRESRPLWEEWWRGAEGTYQRRTPGDRRDRSALELRNDAVGEAGTTFYGLKTKSLALLFVLDVSGSMNEPASGVGVTSSGRKDETKLDRMKREVTRAINGLPTGVAVNLVTYSDGIEWYAPKMVKMGDVDRRAILAWVKNLRARGKTNIHDAMLSALDLAAGTRRSKEPSADTIFLLTDGVPTAGRITDTDVLAAELSRRSRAAGVVVHTIGIGPDHDRRLLEQISSASLGVYVSAR